VRIRNSQLIENLGQINLLLADKTGTLTAGIMKVKLLLVDNQEWPIRIGGEEESLFTDEDPGKSPKKRSKSR
jgi:magnesium-transporting ATPase (P-type)